MKNTLPAITAAITLLLAPNLGAGEISVYKDKDGVINLTDRPVPANTRVQHVIRYRDRRPEELKLQQTELEKGKSVAEPGAESPHLRDLREKAALARKEAEEERSLAREKIKAAEAYLERYRQKSRRQRRQHLKEARRIAWEAEEAQARANAAIERANQLQEEAREAITSQTGKGP